MRLSLVAIGFLAASAVAGAQIGYAGFDKNGYPGDNMLTALHKTFAYTGYWLNDPPGMSSNPWSGKRSVVRQTGLGFLILFNGRLDAQLQHVNAAELGHQDGAAAAESARKEGFRPGALIFLDQEEGGALLAEQASYMEAWIAAVRTAGFRAGVYCSGIVVPAGDRKMSTAQDVAARFPGTKLWVWNDQCPPAPGCVIPKKALSASESGTSDALVWQYAVSPRRPEDTSACVKSYAADNGCYAPGMPHSEATYIDLDVSRSADPSGGR